MALASTRATSAAEPHTAWRKAPSSPSNSRPTRTPPHISSRSARTPGLACRERSRSARAMCRRPARRHSTKLRSWQLSAGGFEELEAEPVEILDHDGSRLAETIRPLKYRHAQSLQAIDDRIEVGVGQ